MRRVLAAVLLALVLAGVAVEVVQIPDVCVFFPWWPTCDDTAGGGGGGAK